MILLVPAYPSPDHARRGEIALCLRANLANAEIARVVVFGQPDTAAHAKLESVAAGERPTFAEMFAFAGQFAGEVVIVANADIYFDATLAQAAGIRPGEMFALSRWCPETQRICGPPMDSGADAWIFRAPLPDALLTALRAEPRQIAQGMPFCDHRLARLALDAGLRVINPSLSVRAWHMHATALRTYTHADTIGGAYAWLPPTLLFAPAAILD
jgi:hypothetical protein